MSTEQTDRVTIPLQRDLDTSAGTPRRPALFNRSWNRVSALSAAQIGADLVAVTVAALLAHLSPSWLAVTVVAVLGCQAGARAYRRRLHLSFSHDVPRSLASLGCAFGLLDVLVLWADAGLGTAQAVVRAVLWFPVLAAPLRVAVYQLTRWARVRFDRGERAIIVGAGGVGDELARLMLAHREFGLRPVGFVDVGPRGIGSESPLPLLGPELIEGIAAHRARVVVLGFSAIQDVDAVDLAITAHQLGVEVLLLPRMWELYPDATYVERLRTFPLVRLTGAPTARVRWFIKRVLDRVLALAALLLAGPVIAVAALAVAVESGGPVFFVQDRVGRDGRVFRLYKLRSLRATDEVESQTRWSVAGDPRIGPVGRLLRRTSVDELPQLWNVLRGDMSLVGPRPERPGFVREFSEIHTRYWARHRVPAGLTGLAQVNGLRGDTSIADRTRYDNYYIASWSLWLDFRIVLMTVRELLRGGQR
jgi:exopolysaccharide biosynthesis polyprenyl glycosylphosphotransferase